MLRDRRSHTPATGQQPIHLAHPDSHTLPRLNNTHDRYRLSSTWEPTLAPSEPTPNPPLLTHSPALTSTQTGRLITHAHHAAKGNTSQVSRTVMPGKGRIDRSRQHDKELGHNDRPTKIEDRLQLRSRVESGFGLMRCLRGQNSRPGWDFGSRRLSRHC